MTTNQIIEQAERLDKAEQKRVQVKPPTGFYPEMTIEGCVSSSKCLDRKETKKR